MQFDKLINNSIPTIKETTSVEECLNIMKMNNLNFLIVVDKGLLPIGIIRLLDVLCDVNEQSNISSLMVTEFHIVKNIKQLEKLFRNNANVPGNPVVVVNTDNSYRGIINNDQLLAYAYTNNQYFEKILNALDVGILAINKEKKVLYSNNEWNRIHAINSNDIIGEDVSLRFPESLMTSVLFSESPLIKNDPVYFRYSGATVLPYYYPLNDDKDIWGSVAIVKDYSKINDFSVNVKELSSSSSVLALAFNNLTEVIFALDNHNSLVFCNPAFQNHFEEKLGDILEDGALFEMASKYPFSNKDVFTGDEFECIDKNNLSNVWSITIIPLLRDGFFIGSLFMLKNITSFRKLKLQIESANDLLKYFEKKLYKNSEEMIIVNKKSKEIFQTANKIANHPIAVLIEGENGVGKELVANYIHSHSDRKNQPFVPINCGAIPESLWESEMFGYEDGAFTGAKKGGKPGMFELANTGTVFLDEVGELSMASQVKMLRFLETMEMTRVGGTKSKKLDVRIISATNQSLESMVSAGTFREDLYYRLNVVYIIVPPLRERPDEILPMVTNFIAYFKKKYQKDIAISDQACEVLLENSWPGNVRQLKNAIEYAVVTCEDVIYAHHLPKHMEKETANIIGEDVKNNGIYAIPIDERITVEAKSDPLSSQIKIVEKEAIKKALLSTNNNRTKAMAILGISRKSFYNKLKEYGLM